MADATPTPTTSMPAVLPDLPVVEDKLDFAPYANTMRDIILSDRTLTPLTIGIFGSWGSGKTSLMRMIEDGLKQDAKDKKESGQTNFRVTHPVWFNAWLYSKEDVLWRALISRVIDGIRRTHFLDLEAEVEKQKDEHLLVLEQQLYRVVSSAELGTLSIRAADLLSKDRQAQESAEITMTLLQGLDLLERIGEIPDEPAGNGEPLPAELLRTNALRNQIRQATARLEQQRIESLDRFKTEFEKLIDLYVKRKGYLVIFVDDLDRCLPEKAVEVLEAIKLFLDVPGCIFVLGIDREVVERGIRLRYGEMAGIREPGLAPFMLSADLLAGDGDGSRKTATAAAYRAFLQELTRPDEDVIDGGRYLEKIIQIPFVLPPISREALGEFIAQMAPDLPHLECGPVFYTGLEPNPRQVKRAINIFSLLWRLSENKTELRNQVAPVRLAKLVVLQQRHKPLYDLLREEPGQLRDWEIYFRQKQNYEEFSSWELNQGRTPTERLDRPAAFDGYDEALMGAVERLLTMHPLTGPLSTDTNFVGLSPEQVQIYVYLTRSVKESVGTPPPSEAGAEAPDRPPTAAVGADVGDGGVAGVIVGSELDESVVGYLKERAFSVLEELAKDPVPADGYDPSQRQFALQRLSEVGGEIYLQLGRDLNRQAELEAALIDPTTIQIAVTRNEAQVPWEVVYDGALPSERLITKQAYVGPEALEVNVEGFWGFKHIIERPLITPSRQSDPAASLTPRTDLLYRERPRLALLFNPKTKMANQVREIYEGLASAGSIELLVAEELSGAQMLLAEKAPDLVACHVPGDAQRGEITLQFIDGRLTRRLLQSWGVSPDGWGKRQPGSALWIFDVNAGLGRRNEWPAWLELLFGMGAGGVVAPMSVPHDSWSIRFIGEFVRALRDTLTVGEALRHARRWMLEATSNPLGLTFAHFGPSTQKLVDAANTTTSYDEVVSFRRAV